MGKNDFPWQGIPYRPSRLQKFLEENSKRNGFPLDPQKAANYILNTYKTLRYPPKTGASVSFPELNKTYETIDDFPNYLQDIYGIVDDGTIQHLCEKDVLEG
jgi:hypothetical protein